MAKHHFGLICPPGTSHVTALATIARELCQRGHRATVFNIADVEELAHKEGLEFCAIGAKDHPKGSFQEFSQKFGQMHGLEALRFGMKIALHEIAMLLEEAPDAIRTAGVTALLIDQGQPSGSTIAERAGLPFITVCNAVQVDPDPNVPPALVNWGPATSPLGRLRNRLAYRFLDLAATPMRKEINAYRTRWGLKPLRSLFHTFSPILELAQQSEEFDFPRLSRPPQFHYIGLIRRRGAEGVSFPFERLDGRPLVYGSLGTVSYNKDVFRFLAEACADLNVQLVITLGNQGNPADYAELPGKPIVVSYAPQFALIERSSVTVCHSGHNTVLDSLACGVPVVAVPLQTDNYGVAARLKYSGTGEWLPLTQLSARHLREAIDRMLSIPSYKERAKVMAASFRKAGGERRAADLIEQKLGDL
jgi:MGT family glycosyltransferase